MRSTSFRSILISDKLDDSSMSIFRADAQEGCRLRGARGAREASTDMGHSAGLVEVGVEEEGRFVLSFKVAKEKEGAEEVAATRSLKTGKAALEEELELKEERVDCLMTLATDEIRVLAQDVRCARVAICFCFGDGFFVSTRTLNGLA